LPISLDTGELLTAKRRRFIGPPTFEPVVTWRAVAADDPAGRTCKDGVPVSSEELLALALAPFPASYPEVAKKARVSGDVVVEVVVSETGAVESVVVVKPLPFGLDQSAAATAGKWQFEPLRRDGRPVRMCGRFVMSFGGRAR
jgi:TonB family protein